jgi:hypothetical protein
MPELKNNTIPPLDVQKMEKLINASQAVYSEKGQIPTLFFVSYCDEHGEDNQYKVFPLVLSGHEMRQFLMHVIKQKRATSVMSIGEGTALALPKDRANELFDKQGNALRASEHPEAKQIIFFTYENKSSFWTGMCYPQKDGSFSEIEWNESESAGGNFANLFPGKADPDAITQEIKNNLHKG